MLGLLKYVTNNSTSEPVFHLKLEVEISPIFTLSVSPDIFLLFFHQKFVTAGIVLTPVLSLSFSYFSHTS